MKLVFLCIFMAISPIFANNNNFSFLHNLSVGKGTYLQILKTIIPSVENSEDSGYMNNSIYISSDCTLYLNIINII